MRTNIGGAADLAAQGAKPEPMAAQLASVLLPTVRQADGSYQVSIRLQPQELGVVHAEVQLQAGTISVSLHAEGDATRDMLRQNLGQLRQQMEGTGLTTGHFDVGSGPGNGADRHPTGWRPTPGVVEDARSAGGDPVATATRAADRPAPLTPTGLLDVRL